MGWRLFSSDVATAFLQGKAHPESRTLWIQLPADARKLLGVTSPTSVMKLRKPMYGLVDAPRAWYLEAKERVMSLGAVAHPLDSCLFMLFDETDQSQMKFEGEETMGKLVAAFGLHVDDILGCCAPNSKRWEKFQTELKGIFTFRTWEEATESHALEYCGAKIRVGADYISLEQEDYLKKQKPISFPEEGETRPVTERERSSLRALIGKLQWPATQTSPHLQAMISTLAGRVKDATTETLREANKILRFAKHHSDVRLQFRPLGEPQNLTFMIYSDAAFASRQDLSSQGGYLLILVHKDVRMGSEGYYNVVDWRSWKLPRVARSSLSVESQAASEAADTLLYTCTFWRLLWMPYLDLEAVSTARLHCAPCLIIDAKALYDLLSRLEASSPGGADKRTAIEVLVTQDKLRCAQAQTLWVSSELQFSDGLTKDSAAQLLAERLRTHMTRVKPDPNFQAAKRKDPVARKAGAEAYAQKRPTRALQAAVLAVHRHMFSTHLCRIARAGCAHPRHRLRLAAQEKAVPLVPILVVHFVWNYLRAF